MLETDLCDNCCFWVRLRSWNIYTIINHLLFRSDSEKFSLGKTSKSDYISNKPNRFLYFLCNTLLINLSKRNQIRIIKKKNSNDFEIWLEKQQIFIYNQLSICYNNGMENSVLVKFQIPENRISYIDILFGCLNSN